jgi:hypothetical protein
MSNGMARVQRLSNFNEPLEEGYFPKLDNSVASHVWPARHAGTTLKVSISNLLQHIH